MCKKLCGKVLDQYLTVINKEKAKLNKEKAKEQSSDSDSDSDSDHSMAMIEQIIPVSKKRKMEEYLNPKQLFKDNEKTEEEKAYLKQVHEGDDITEASTLSEN